MAHIVTCRICKAKIDTDSSTNWVMPSKNYYYHKTCYDDFGKKKGAIQEGDLMIELDDEMWFTKDLKMIPTFYKLSSQWKSFIKKGMTAKGIYFTLRYFYEINKGDTKKSENGIGIVPFIYDEATCYWGERNQRDKGICDRIEQQILKSRAITRKKIYKQAKPKPQKRVDLAAIAELNDEED